MPRSASANLSASTPPESSQRRLQRPPDFTGGLLTRFQDVSLRHGLPGVILAGLCLMHPGARELLTTALMPAMSQFGLYAIGALGLLILLCGLSWMIDKSFSQMKLLWVAYLLGISIWEEWVFRLAIPAILNDLEVDLRIAIVVSNMLFGLIHYFTLRWKWQWCFAAFLGGLALSRQFMEGGDFALIVAIHWIATFLNTPRFPGQKRNAR